MILLDKLNSYILENCSPTKFLTKVRLEACSVCQLNCKTCYMRLNDSGAIGKGSLSFENFKRFVDENKFINLIELSSSGEIFLNPELNKIIEYANEKHVRLEARGGVNFNTVSEETLENLVKYKFRHLTIAIDGASQEIYSQYRVNGDFDKVIENIKKLNSFKKKYKSNYPKMNWQYVVMSHNQCGIKPAKKLAKELNMKIHFKLNWDRKDEIKVTDSLKKETNMEQVKRVDYEKKNKRAYAIATCQQLVSSPQINWDGRLLGCCSLYKSDFGVNVFEVGLEKSLKYPKFSYAKKMLQGKVEFEEEIPCSTCKKYQFIKKHRKYIKFKIIENWIFRKIYQIFY